MMDAGIQDNDGGAAGGMLRLKRRRHPSVDAASSQKVKCSRQDGRDCTTEEQSEDDGGEAHMIFSQYEVVRTILCNLPLQDLRAAAQVCSSWKSVAKIILQSRTKLEWFLGTHNRKSEEILKTKLYSDPKLCILFVRRKKIKFLQWVHNFMGPACQVVLVPVDGLVGTEVGTLESKEIEADGTLNMSALLMPTIPGLTCRTFELSNSQLKRFCRKDNLSPGEVLKLTSISPADEVKCLLLFCSSDFSEKSGSLLLSIRNRQTERLVVGGALCSFRHDWIYGVALSGPSVIAASMILPKTIKSKLKAEEYFEKFQKDTEGFETQQTLCFMFACVGRGEQMYGEPDVESSLFRKYFPSTPLVGFFGLGEIGCNSVPTAAAGGSILSEASYNSFRDYLHDFSTVFVYLGFS